MRKGIVAVASLVLAGWMAPSMGAQDEPKTGQSKEDLQRLYMDFLKQEGYRPEIDKDGDVRFKKEGLVYFIPVSEKDPQFFTIVLANIWNIENEKERIKVLRAADASNAKSKVAKVYTVKDNVWVSIEVFVQKPEEFKGIFERSLSALSNGVKNFVAKMKEDL